MAQELKVSPSPRERPKHRRAICEPVFHPGQALCVRTKGRSRGDRGAGDGREHVEARAGRRGAPGHPDEQARTRTRLCNLLAGFGAQLYPPLDDLGEQSPPRAYKRAGTMGLPHSLKDEVLDRALNRAQQSQHVGNTSHRDRR